MKGNLLVLLACFTCTVSIGADAPAKPNPDSGFKSAKPINVPNLRWPLGVRRDREAFFSLRIVVSPEGKVSEATVQEDSGFYTPAFLSEAMSVTKAMTFKPATFDGKPVEQAFILPIAFGIGANGVSPEFKVEAQKVNDLFKSGDYAGADFHAEWMLKETVRYGYEYALLKSTLAQTHASLGHDHEAIVFAEEATQRTSQHLGEDATSGEAIFTPVEYWIKKDLVISLLNMRMRLAARHGMLMKALKAYHEVAGLEKIAATDPRAALATQLTGKLNSNEPVAAEIVLVQHKWDHELYRRRFTVEHLTGNLSSITLVCGKTRQSLTYVPGEEWTVPDGLRDCVVVLVGDSDTRFQLIELAT